MHIRLLYFRNIFLYYFKNYWKWLLAIVVLCGISFAILGYRNAMKASSPETYEKNQEYYKQVEYYDAAISDLQKSIEEKNKSISNMQNYIDHSILMNLNPEEIYVANIQYVVNPDSGSSVAPFQYAIISFINDGELVAAAGNMGKSMNSSEWHEIVTVTTPSNLLVISVMYSDAENARNVLNLISECLMEKVPEIASEQGLFSLEGGTISEFVKADVTIANSQNNTLNALSAATSSRSDLETKLVSLIASKESYIKNNAPKFSETASGTLSILKFGAFGLLTGVILIIGILSLIYILSDKIRSPEELVKENVPVLAEYRRGLMPDTDRLAMDLSILKKTGSGEGIYFQCFTDKAETMLSDIEAALQSEVIQFSVGFDEGDSAENLRKMISLGNVVLVLEAGRSTFKQVEKQMRLCNRFGIRLMGCILYA